MKKGNKLFVALLIGSLLSATTTYADRSKETEPEKTSEQARLVPVDAEIEKVNKRLVEAEQALLQRLEETQAANHHSQVTDHRPLADAALIKASLRSDISFTTTETGLKNPTQQALDQLRSRHATLKSKVKVQDDALSKLKQMKRELEEQLRRNERKTAQLAGELEETRNRLIVSETEVERLSRIHEARNRRDLDSLAPARPAAKAQRYARSRAVTGKRQSLDRANKELIATVSVPKANLRTGPGKNNSPIMSVKKGSRLLVETRNGNWYRVVTPEGTRAWISGEVVSFGNRASSGPTRISKVQGYNRDVENRAYELIKGHTIKE